jgi:hypothetical protein
MGDGMDKALEVGSELFRKIAGPLAEEVGESIGVVARHYRYKLAVKMRQKTERMLKDAGINPHAVPPRLFLPIAENASMQDDEDLHTRWAALLANAAAVPDSVHPSFIEVLRQLTPQDARLLDDLYDSCVKRGAYKIQPWVQYMRHIDGLLQSEEGGYPAEQFENLTRLGLIQTIYELGGNMEVGFNRRGGAKVMDAKLDNDDYVTDFAVRFVKVCRAPTTTIEGQIV